MSSSFVIFPIERSGLQCLHCSVDYLLSIFGVWIFASVATSYLHRAKHQNQRNHLPMTGSSIYFWTEGVTALRYRWIHASTRLDSGAFGPHDDRHSLGAFSRILGQGRVAFEFTRLEFNGLFAVIHLGAEVLANSIQHVALKAALTHACHEMTVENFTSILGNFRKLLRKCIEAKGGNFERVL